MMKRIQLKTERARSVIRDIERGRQFAVRVCVTALISAWSGAIPILARLQTFYTDNERGGVERDARL